MTKGMNMGQLCRVGEFTDQVVELFRLEGLLNDMVGELLNFRDPALPGGEQARANVRAIGAELNAAGGLMAMKEAFETVLHRHGERGVSVVNEAWGGIGRWTA